MLIFLKGPFFISLVAFCMWCVQVLSAKVPSEEKRREWWQAFYQGAAFPTLARFLLLGNVLALYLHCVVLVS